MSGTTDCQACGTLIVRRNKHRRMFCNAYCKRRHLRNVILRAYGAECKCCGERQDEFLSIDHVNGGGNRERQTIGLHFSLKKIIADGFPSTYRILCMNCNFSLGRRGYCPHGGV